MIVRECYMVEVIGRDAAYGGYPHNWLTEGLIVRYWPFPAGQLLIRRHQHRKGKLDELLVLADGVQGSAHVVGDIGGTTRLHPVGQCNSMPIMH